FLLHEEPDKELVQPGEQVPVKEAKIVTDDVVAIVGEFDALSLALAAAFALHPAEEDFPRDQFELLQPGQEFRVEQRWRLRVRHCWFSSILGHLRLSGTILISARLGAAGIG